MKKILGIVSSKTSQLKEIFGAKEEADETSVLRVEVETSGKGLPGNRA